MSNTSQTEFKVENVVKVTKGWVADINGYPWVMNRFGVVTSIEADPALDGVLGSEWRSMKSSDMNTQNAFTDAIEALGFTYSYDRTDRVYAQRSSKANLQFVKDGSKAEVIRRLKEKNLLN